MSNRKWLPSNCLPIPMSDISSWRVVTWDGSGDVEIKVDGQWFIYSSGPSVADDALELVLAGIPQAGDASNPPEGAQFTSY